ncbi:UNVERIFIED_CONTAM: hypothetical protein PYX00_000340 [Menopon gallinae]|uniref:SMP-LTD domain-containing protein n=1 Tax=Menopon gallinae TaxID=328185 RepID=A0AAW2I9V4_9NEOP
MSQSKPDNLGKNAGGTSVWDFAVHFRAKDDTVTEVPLHELRNDRPEKEPLEAETLEQLDQALSQENDSNLKVERAIVSNPSGSHSSSSSPSDYKKMFRNLNQFRGKITRSVEEKLSEIKSDLGSNKPQLLSSKDNSSLSDSEENSDGSGSKVCAKDSSRKSLSLDLVTDKEMKDPVLEITSELTQRKSTWSPGGVKYITYLVGEGRRMTQRFHNFVEVEPAVEAYEQTDPDDTDDDGQYVDARDDLPDDNHRHNRKPEGELLKLIRFIFQIDHRYDGIAVFLLVCFFALPVPAFLKGFMSCFCLIKIWRLLCSFWSLSLEGSSLMQTVPFEVPDYNKLPPLKTPQVAEEKGVLFNEYTEPYDPEWYSITQTVPVYMEIEDSLLKLSRPKGKISKRAYYDERTYKLEFLHERVYDLTNCTITLKPLDIIRKRYFNKKFPISIELRPRSLVKCVRFKDSNLDEEPIPLEETYQGVNVTRSKFVYGKDYLNLFARCNRQKEEWFRRLIAAAEFRKDKNDIRKEPSMAFGRLHFNADDADYDEYWQYMTEIVMQTDSGLFEISEKEAALRSAVEIQWFNALINRFLFDIFRTPYWLNRIQHRIQKKLATVRVPYYIEALEIIEMDLGKMGPRFHRVSPPSLDRRGLWFDMDMTFDGAIRIVLQTQLNLVKLQHGLEEEAAKGPESRQDSGFVFRVRKSDRDMSSMHHTSKKDSMKELMLEFAEIAVSDKSKYKFEPSTNSMNVMNSDSSDSEDEEEDDDDDDDDDEDSTSYRYNPQPLRDTSRSVRPSGLSRLRPSSIYDTRKPMRKSSKKLFRMMENFAQSKYFKSLAETKYVQRAIAGVSAMKLRLLLEFKSCIGTIVVNVPPPPNDRIWYGFRTIPKLWLSAQPQIGDRNIKFYNIKQYVEKKIMDEIKKFIVLPNMDDIVYPVPPNLEQAGKSVSFMLSRHNVHHM